MRLAAGVVTPAVHSTHHKVQIPDSAVRTKNKKAASKADLSVKAKVLSRSLAVLDKSATPDELLRLTGH